MFETLRNALKVKDIRKRLLFTLVVLIICRLGSQLPIPGIDTDTISRLLYRKKISIMKSLLVKEDGEHVRKPD